MPTTSIPSLVAVNPTARASAAPIPSKVDDEVRQIFKRIEIAAETTEFAEKSAENHNEAYRIAQLNLEKDTLIASHGEALNLLQSDLREKIEEEERRFLCEATAISDVIERWNDHNVTVLTVLTSASEKNRVEYDAKTAKKEIEQSKKDLADAYLAYQQNIARFQDDYQKKMKVLEDAHLKELGRIEKEIGKQTTYETRGRSSDFAGKGLKVAGREQK